MSMKYDGKKYSVYKGLLGGKIMGITWVVHKLTDVNTSVNKNKRKNRKKSSSPYEKVVTWFGDVISEYAVLFIKRGYLGEEIMEKILR